MALAERESGAARLEEAIAAYRAALEELTRERVPLDWAAMQNNLGYALAKLGERENSTARLEEAVAVTRSALQQVTRERDSVLWARAQDSLAYALAALGERERGTVRLKEAIAAFSEALQERTRDRAPLRWATSFGNQGVAIMRIADRTDDGRLAEIAAQQIEAALETARSGGDKHLSEHFQMQLTKAQAIRDRLKGK